jgi:hypothetical protein
VIFTAAYKPDEQADVQEQGDDSAADRRDELVSSLCAWRKLVFRLPIMAVAHAAAPADNDASGDADNQYAPHETYGILEAHESEVAALVGIAVGRRIGTNLSYWNHVSILHHSTPRTELTFGRSRVQTAHSL